MTMKYLLEFILHAKGSSLKLIRSSLAEFGDDIVVSEDEGKKEDSNYKVSMVTEDPTLVFDICSQFGRIRSVKAHEDSA